MLLHLRLLFSGRRPFHASNPISHPPQPRARLPRPHTHAGPPPHYQSLPAPWATAASRAPCSWRRSKASQRPSSRALPALPPHPSTAPRPPTPPGATSAAHLPTRYVPLSHPEEIEGAPPGGRYIAGVTNCIFEQKRGCYDAIGVFSSGHVTLSAAVLQRHRIKVSGRQLRHIKYVLAGIDRDQRGEQWARPARQQGLLASPCGTVRHLRPPGGSYAPRSAASAARKLAVASRSPRRAPKTRAVLTTFARCESSSVSTPKPR